jgi:hypothetical protein
LILGLDFAAGSCEMYEFFVYFHEMHELLAKFNEMRELLTKFHEMREFLAKCTDFQLIFFVYSGQNAIILATLAS